MQAFVTHLLPLAEQLAVLQVQAADLQAQVTGYFGNPLAAAVGL
jgi:hypothetical protein